MPKSKAEIMRALRRARKEQGLVEFRRWVKPKTKKALEKIVEEME